jgi:hypothetical protein
MELFLPGIAALLISALIVFLVLPRLGAPVLVGLSVVLLVFCLYNHYTLFASEYRYSTWQEQLKWYGPVVLYGGLTIAVLMYLGYLYSGKGASILPASNISAEPTTITEAVNNTAEAATNAVNAVSNAVGLGNVIGNANKGNNRGNNKPSNNSVLGNLGGILNSPKRNNNNNRGLF